MSDTAKRIGFLLGLVASLIGIWQFFSSGQYYHVIDINLDHASSDVKSALLEEGAGTGNNIFRVGLRSSRTEELSEKLKNNPEGIFLVRLTGTTPIDGRWIGEAAENESFSLELLRQESKEYRGNLIFHFPSYKKLQGWNSFEEEVASSNENWIKLMGFFRFVTIKGKMDINEQYKLQPVTSPNEDGAKEALSRLKM